MAKRIYTKLSKDKVTELLKQIPGIVKGEQKDRYGLHNKFWSAVAHSMFTSLSEAFEAKSQGGQDELGNTWEDIDPRTKAYSRPIRRGDLTARQARANKNPNLLGILTPNQYKQWRKIFGSIYHSEKNKIGEEEAKKLAGQIAWAKLKRMGAQTKIDVLGNRDVLILRDTDRLFRSFLPGKLTTNTYRRYNKDQVFVVRKGDVEIGTKVEYAGELFEDRPLWAGDLSPWIRKASHSATQQIVKFIEESLA